MDSSLVVTGENTEYMDTDAGRWIDELIGVIGSSLFLKNIDIIDI